jgi:hypothetical protein
MFRESEKGLKEDSFLGVPRVGPGVMIHQTYEAQTCNHNRTKRTPEPKVINDGMDAKMKPGST